MTDKKNDYGYYIDPDTMDKMVCKSLSWHYENTKEDLVKHKIHPEDRREALARIAAFEVVMDYYGIPYDRSTIWS